METGFNMRKAFKFFVLLVAFGIVIPFLAAGAEAEKRPGLVITDSNFIYNRQSGISFFFAKVENKGSEYLSLNNSVFTAYDRDGNVLFESPDITLTPGDLLIAPDDFAFISTMMFDTADTGWQEKTERYNVELNESTEGERYNRIACTEKHSLSTMYNLTQISLDVIFSNDTEDIMEETELVYALFDQEQNLMAVDYTCFPGMAFFPQSKIRQHVYIYTDIQEWMLQNNRTPETISAYLYSRANK